MIDKDNIWTSTQINDQLYAVYHEMYRMTTI